MVDQKFTVKVYMINKILSIILIASIIASSAILIYIIVTPKPCEKFTEFYLLDSNGTASDYPKELKVGEEGKVIIGIVNKECENFTYRLEVYLNESLIHEENVPLINNEKWESQFKFKAVNKGENQKLEFLIYKEQWLEAYRALYLWINII